MFWEVSTPGWAVDLGLVGSCAHCGFVGYTMDHLEEPITGRRREGSKRGPDRKNLWRARAA